MLKKVGKLTTEVAKCFLYQMLLGLQELHRLKICHRDLKPDNMLLTDDFSLKLGDFSTCKVTKPDCETLKKLMIQRERELENVSPTREMTFVGTPRYMSPEILSGKGASYLSDLWAIGVVLYQMLTNKCPFDGMNAYLTYQQIKEGEIEFPDDIDEQGKDLITQMLKQNPFNRIGACKDGSIDFERIFSHPFLDGFQYAKIKSKLRAKYSSPRKQSSSSFNLNNKNTFNSFSSQVSNSSQDFNDLFQDEFEDSEESKEENKSQLPFKAHSDLDKTYEEDKSMPILKL